VPSKWGNAMFEQTVVDTGDQVAAQLLNWVNTPATAELEPVEMEMRPAVVLLRTVQDRMRALGYRLRSSMKYSPADLCGMDHVLDSVRLDRYFWLDITVDPVIKRTLSALSKRFIFVAVTHQETKTVTVATRISYLRRLLELMDGPPVLTLSGAMFPDLAFESRADRLLQGIETFQERLLSYAQAMRPLKIGFDNRPQLVLAYREGLNGTKMLAEEESNRRSSSQFRSQENVLLGHLSIAVRTAWSATIAGAAYPWKPRLNTHSVRLDMRRGQIVLVVNGQQFRLDGVVRKIADCEERVWNDRAKRKPIDFELKRRLSSEAGRKLVAENLVRVLESTPLSILIGEGEVAPPVADSATAQHRYRSARPTPK